MIIVHMCFFVLGFMYKLKKKLFCNSFFFGELKFGVLFFFPKKTTKIPEDITKTEIPDFFSIINFVNLL